MSMAVDNSEKCLWCLRWRDANDFLRPPRNWAFLPLCSFCWGRSINRAELLNRSQATDTGTGTVGDIKVSEVLELGSGDSLKLTVADRLQSKRQDNRYPKVIESVRLNGVQRPVLIRRGELMNGHHRVAACVDLGIETIPFTDDFNIGWDH